MNFKKILSLLAALSLSVFLLSGCAGGNTKLELNLEPDTGKIKMLSKIIKPDGGSISVSADNIPSGAELQVYLYNEAQPGEYLMSVSLNSTKKSAEFVSLSKDLNYKIGAVLFGTDKNLKLRIKYNER